MKSYQSLSIHHTHNHEALF